MDNCQRFESTHEGFFFGVSLNPAIDTSSYSIKFSFQAAEFRASTFSALPEGKAAHVAMVLKA